MMRERGIASVTVFAAAVAAGIAALVVLSVASLGKSVAVQSIGGAIAFLYSFWLIRRRLGTVLLGGPRVNRADEPDAAPVDELVASLPSSQRTRPRIAEARFTVVRPRFASPRSWSDLDVVVHDGTVGQDEVLLHTGGRQPASTRTVTTVEFVDDLRYGCRLTIVPQVAEVEFNPPLRWLRWEEPLHSERFRFRSLRSRERATCGGAILVFGEDRLLLAEIPIVIRFGTLPGAAEGEDRQTTPAFRKIFASYSRKDADVVRSAAAWARSTGDRYLRDVVELRSGEVWSGRIAELIQEADIFQLFWSRRSMVSEYVRREWEYALELGRPGFIRPVYWQQPMPRSRSKGLPPESLARLHFALLPDLKDKANRRAALSGGDQHE